MTTARELRKVIANEADKLGVGVKFGHTAKHCVATLDDGHSTRRVVFSATPSDINAVHQVARNVRDTVQDMQELRRPAPSIVPMTAPRLDADKLEPVRPWATAPVIVEPTSAPELKLLYHFTSSAHLPHIIEGGLAVFERDGVRDLLWATNNGDSERVATDKFKQGRIDPYRDGSIQRVRIGLHYSDFAPWREVAEAEPGWTPARIETLERSARERGQDTSGWYARREPLGFDRIIGIDTRSYRSHKWAPFKSKTLFAANDRNGFDVKGVEIGDKVYFSTQKWADGEHDLYDLLRPVEADRLIAAMVRGDDAENEKRDLLLGGVTP